MNRRSFASTSLKIAAGFAINSSFANSISKQNLSSSIRLGGPVFGDFNDPELWVNAHKALGYKAAYCTLKTNTATDIINAYKKEAEKADIIIAEVGAWSNPLDPDPEKSKRAIQHCIDSLALAETIGANCCVNVSGSKSATKWAGPHKDNLSEETFEQIVNYTRKIIDEIKPTRTFFTVELMPWSIPDSVDEYVRLIKAVDRKSYGVHLDPCNIINSPRNYYNNSELIKECFKKLGNQIRSCHGKDILLKDDSYSTQIVECRPGLGNLNYNTFLSELKNLKNIPLMLEHLPNADEYVKAANHVRSVGKSLNIEM